MQHDPPIYDLIHEKYAPADSLVGRRHAHEGATVSTCHGDAGRDGVTLSDLLLDLVLEVRKGRAHEWMALEHLLKSRMLGEACEVMPVERLKEPTNHGFLVVS
jgi:hypothetical protein